MFFNTITQKIDNFDNYNDDDNVMADGTTLMVDNILRYHLQALLDRGFWILDIGLITGKQNSIYVAIDNDLPEDDLPYGFFRTEEYIACVIEENDNIDVLTLFGGALLELYNWITKHDLKKTRC